MKTYFKWLAAHKIVTGILIFIVLVVAVTNGSKNNATNTSTTTPSPTKQTVATKPATPKPAAKVAARQVTGTATTLGAGTFAGGKDVAVGLYDVTAGAGQSGNFMVDGTDSYNEILGNAGAAGGVPKVRVKISSGDKITISGLSAVTFTPVTTPFVTTHVTTALYTGTFKVGEDIGAGRYVANPASGESGNFMVDGTDSYNEILGNAGAAGGVPSLSVTLSKGDVISISGISQVTLTAQ